VGIAEQVAEVIDVAHVAAEQCLKRIALEISLIAFLEQSEQALVRALLRGICCVRRSLRERARRRCERNQAAAKDQAASGVHAIPLVVE